MAGQIGDLNPWTNQKTAVVNHSRQIDFPAGIVPADIVVARRHLPPRVGEQQAGKHGAGGLSVAYEITKLRSVRNAVNKIEKKLSRDRVTQKRKGHKAETKQEKYLIVKSGSGQDYRANEAKRKE